MKNFEKLFVSLSVSILLVTSSFAVCVDSKPYLDYKGIDSTLISDGTIEPTNLNSANIYNGDWWEYDLLGDGILMFKKDPFGNQMQVFASDITKNILINESTSHTIKLGDTKFLTLTNAFTGDANITISGTSCTPACSDEINATGTFLKYDNNGTCEIVESDSYYDFGNGVVVFNKKEQNKYYYGFRYYDEDSNISTLDIYTSEGENRVVYPFLTDSRIDTLLTFDLLSDYVTFTGVYPGNTDPSNHISDFEFYIDNKYLRVRSNYIYLSSLNETFYHIGDWDRLGRPNSFVSTLEYLSFYSLFFTGSVNYKINESTTNGFSYLSGSLSNSSKTFYFTGYYHLGEIYFKSSTYQARYYFDYVSKDLGL